MSDHCVFGKKSIGIYIIILKYTVYDVICKTLTVNRFSKKSQKKKKNEFKLAKFILKSLN